MKSFHLVMHAADGRESEARGEFTDEEWHLLQRFAECAEQLRQTRLAHGGKSAFGWKWSRDEGVSWSWDLPTDDEVSAFLHRLRPLILKKETTYFPRICNILIRHIEEPQIRKALQLWRDAFLAKQAGDIQIASGPVRINSEATLEKWLNAFEYHRDSEKQAEVNALLEGFPPEVTRAIFVNMLIVKAQACIEVLKAVRAIELRAARESGAADGG